MRTFWFKISDAAYQPGKKSKKKRKRKKEKNSIKEHYIFSVVMSGTDSNKKQYSFQDTYHTKIVGSHLSLD